MPIKFIMDIEESEAYAEWLHEVVSLGNWHCLEVEPVKHSDVLVLFFRQEKSPEDAILEYAKFLVRYNAIKENYQSE